MSLSPAMAAFFEESESHLEVIESSLLDLEKSKGDKDIINELFRAVHSLKGNAGLVGLLDIHNVAISMETLLDEIRSKEGKVAQAELDRLFDFHDKLQHLVEDARNPDKASTVGTAHPPEPVVVAEPLPMEVEPPAEPEPEELAPEETLEEPERAEAEEKPQASASQPIVEKAPIAPAPSVPEEKEKEKSQPVPSHLLKKAVADEQVVSYLTFFLSGEQYGFDINAVREIILKRAITRVPNANPYVVGIMNLRGMVIPVIDAKKRLAFPASEESSEHQNIIVLEDEGITTGVMVDIVEDIARLRKDQIVPAEQALGGTESKFIDGVGKMDKRTIMLVDVSTFCNTREDF